MGEFRKKAKEIQAHVKQTEPHSPWQNAAEGMIPKVKRGIRRKMLEKKVPAKLWDHAVEYESLVRSHTTLDSYELDGQVPETIVLGQTANFGPLWNMVSMTGLNGTILKGNSQNQKKFMVGG